jgi:hypothetical protein
LAEIVSHRNRFPAGWQLLGQLAVIVNGISNRIIRMREAASYNLRYEAGD